MPNSETKRPKAYSYVRFSTPEQAKGASYERQLEKAQDYARANGLELADLTFKDLGISAYRGKNAQTGALRAFLTAVEEGEIAPGSYLLVESLDRLTRDKISAAQGLFMLIIAGGITVVTLMDGRAYSQESIDANPTDLIISIVVMMRGHEESATKSKRLLDVYERKRRAASNGNAEKPFTRALPAWITWDDKARAYKLIPERERVIRQIFDKADAGWGQHAIAQWLNEKGVPTWGGTGKQRKAEYWHRSYVVKILTNPAVVGTFTPHKKVAENGKRKRIPLDPIENYWPAAIGRELYERVSSRTHATAPRGRHAGRKAASIFAGLLKCSHCGSSFIRVNKGQYSYLVCSRAHAKASGCSYSAVPYDTVADAVIRNAGAIIRYAPRGHNVRDLDGEIERLDKEVSILSDQASGLADELALRQSEVLRGRLRTKEAELGEAKERLRTLRAKRESLSKPYVLKRLTAVKDALRRKPLNTELANHKLKEAVRKIVIDPDEGTLEIYWHHADEPQEGPTFSVRPFSKKRAMAGQTAN